MMLALRLLWRNRRCAEMPILLLALVLAVALVTAVQVFSARLDRYLLAGSSQFLGADRMVRRTDPAPAAWDQQAAAAGVATARVTEFASMVYAGEAMQLAAVKAVSANYPLRGQLRVSARAFAPAAAWETAAGVPAAGTVWVDGRLLPLLNIQPGATLEVGELPLVVEKILMEEPDRGDSLALFGIRVLMNEADLAATGVIQPGSRIDYQWLLAGAPAAVQALLDNLQPALGLHDRVQDVSSAQRGLATALTTAGQFLLLTGMTGVLLAGVALAIAARRFAERQVSQVALLKALGASAGKVRRLYLIQLLALAALGLTAGLAAGELTQQLAAGLLFGGDSAQWPPAHWRDYQGGVLTGLICLFGFCVPSLWHLPAVAPVTVFRGGAAAGSVGQLLRLGWGAAALLALVALLSGNAWLALSFGGGLALLVVLAAGLLTLLLGSFNRLSSGRGYVWRVVGAGLQRYPARTLTQILAFAAVLMMLLTLAGIRAGLLDDWETQLAADTPNYFFMNIAAHEREPLQALLQTRGIASSPFYPMVRGRLTEINRAPIAPALYQAVNALQRELNLSWAAEFPADNTLVSGVWWDSPALARRLQDDGLIGASVEQELAAQLGLQLGDTLSLSVGGQLLQAEVTSIRQLRWDSMRPNFYVLLSPGALDAFAPTLLTSLHLDATRRPALNTVLQQFPTIVVIELERVLAQVRAMVAQVSQGLLFMFGLIVPGALLVLAAVVHSSMDERRHEASLLRALGARRGLILGGIALEFLVCGLFAGVLAVLGSEVVLLGLQHWVLQMPLSLHPLLWLSGPLLGALCVAALGLISCYSVVTTSPLLVLRQAG